MDNLLPCPFCGGEAETVHEIDGFWTVECVKCGALVDGIEAWNTRAQTVFGMTFDEVRQMMKRDAERERTCEVLGEDYDELLEYWETELSCGHVFNGMAQYVDYCPKCGAKVVEQ